MTPAKANNSGKPVNEIKRENLGLASTCFGARLIVAHLSLMTLINPNTSETYLPDQSIIREVQLNPCHTPI